jgi:carbonic anhydrase
VGNFGDDLKAVVVLGHSGCGAVTAAVDAYVDPVRYLGLSSAHQLRGIVDAVIPAVRGAARSLAAAWGDGVDSAAGYRTALVEASVVVNAALVAHILAETFGTEASARRVVFGVYDLATRRVHVPTSPDPDCGPVVGLVDAPRTEQDFVKFVAQVTRSGHVKRLLA